MRKWVSAPNIRKISILACFLGLWSCAPDEICFTENGTQVKIDFKRIIYPNTDSAFLENDTLIVFQIAAEATDSIFVQADTVSSVVLPVNTNADATNFLFETNLGVNSLELTYHRTQRLISVDCGPEQIIDELELAASNFDSLDIIRPNLLEEPLTNVEIYR